MKRTFVNLKGTIRQSASLPDANLRPHRRYTTADRQAVPGPAVRCGRSVRTPLGLVWFPAGPPRGVLQRRPLSPAL